jgi:hypothetical protein
MRRFVLVVIASVVAGLLGPAAVPASADGPSAPAAPTGTFGTASAWVTYFESNQIYFTFQGQIAIGNRVFHGIASGYSTIAPPQAYGDPTTDTDLGPFTLSGASSSGSLTATCSGRFVGSAILSGLPAGEGRSTLTCDGSANGGTPGSVTITSVYRVTSFTVGRGTYAHYEGAFVGNAPDLAVPPGPLPVLSESETVTVNPNAPIAPSHLLELCVTSKTLRSGPGCTDI